MRIGNGLKDRGVLVGGNLGSPTEAFGCIDQGYPAPPESRNTGFAGWVHGCLLPSVVILHGRAYRLNGATPNASAGRPALE